MFPSLGVSFPPYSPPLSTNMSHSHKATPVDDDGVTKCYEHALKASLRTSNTTHNPGRLFYCCSKDMDDPDRCQFFYWADDPIFKREFPISQVMSSSPSSQQRTVGVWISTPPTTPSPKRKYPTSQQSSITSSQNRLRIMEDALSKSPTRRNDVSCQRLSSTPESKRQRLVQIESVLSSTSKTPHSLQRPENSNKSNYDVNEPQLFQNLARTPTKGYPTLPPSNQTTGHSSDMKRETDVNTKLWTLGIPANSFQELETCVEKVDSNVKPTVSSPRGKPSTEADNTHWRPDDPDNPFEDSGFSNPDPDSSMYLISSLLNHLDAISDYLQRLERQKVAAEKSNQAKANKIFELEQEVARLKLNEQELEKTINTLESRCR
ncbi:hypothetical protein BDZ94DRAFT_43541 [Collybia nuda]|uniref:GRF-type domain-containing protein n=1 Tax=Collybia nuda TaxID=64659 RepID=A0A9P5YLC9_9AGAR|nr:hypothetical protein BDZ94DRAFT_43541 [Collybia nuda]